MAQIAAAGGLIGQGKGTEKMWKANMSPEEAAQVVERFLEKRSLYPQEWNDFVDTPQTDGMVEAYRRECYELDPQVNRPGSPDPNATERLRAIVERLRSGVPQSE